jgi:hypothetical protein
VDLPGRRTVDASHLRSGGRSLRRVAAGDIQAFIASLVEEQLLQESIADTEAPVTVAARGGALAYARPQLQVYTDMKDLLQLNPIHDVSEEGWPTRPTADKV